MKASYDSVVSALKIRWGDSLVAYSKVVESCIILDYDSDGNVIGFELLNASQNVSY